MNLEQVTQLELDWLAEGEMNADERQQLLARLDHTPDGWKRCAFALLESQSLGRSLTMVRALTHISDAPIPCRNLPTTMAIATFPSFFCPCGPSLPRTTWMS